MKVNIIDGDTLIYLVTYNKKDSPPKSVDDCYRDMDSLLNNIFQATKTTHYLLYLTIGKNFRYDVEPTYKENRKKQEKPSFFYEVRQYLIDKWKAQYNEDYESDDLCVSARKILLRDKIDCIISSPDKDIKMLEGETFDYKKFEFKVTSEIDADEYFWRSMIVGDSSDGVKGIPKAGEKFVEKLFNDEELKLFLTPSELVFYAYNRNYYNNENLAIEEFYKNYKLLKIKDDVLTFVEPIPVEVAVESKVIEI